MINVKPQQRDEKLATFTLRAQPIDIITRSRCTPHATTVIWSAFVVHFTLVDKWYAAVCTDRCFVAVV